MNTETKSQWLSSQEKWARRIRDRRQLVKALLLTLASYFILGMSGLLPEWLRGEEGSMIYVLIVYFPLSFLLVALGRRRDANLH